MHFYHTKVSNASGLCTGSFVHARSFSLTVPVEVLYDAMSLGMVGVVLWP